MLTVKRNYSYSLKREKIKNKKKGKERGGATDRNKQTEHSLLNCDSTHFRTMMIESKSEPDCDTSVPANQREGEGERGGKDGGKKEKKKRKRKEKGR